jgi:hypothetical protein
MSFRMCVGNRITVWLEWAAVRYSFNRMVCSGGKNTFQLTECAEGEGREKNNLLICYYVAEE